MPEDTLKTTELPAPSHPTSDPTPATTARAAPTVAVGPRYQLLAEIAHGGMGVVYRAIDTVLEREVAVKVLQDRFALDSGVARRFGDEARIAAQLQHPAIPPVHDIGTLPDGRPFLAMKLIKGQTFEDLLSARTDPSVERGHDLAVFEQICQAMAYAHAHQVIHRDLKPANVMVGAYGEVQLMDWGLAKVLNARPSESADPQETRAGTEVASLRDSDGSFTQAGSVLGTLAFMPPEQAVGAVAKVDQRSDVFGLGAILTVILTGQPPFAAASAETTRLKAAQGDVGECFARLDSSGAEPELVALCKRCLNPKASERPADGAKVAAAVASLRQAAEERARAAELERVRAEGERVAAELRAAEERKRRLVQAALAVAVALLLVGGMVFGWWQAKHHERNAEAVAKLLERCEQALDARDAGKALVALETAQKRAAEGGVSPDQSERLARYMEDLNLLRALDAVNAFRWTELGSGFPALEAVASRYREVLERFGADPDAVGAATAVARLSGSKLKGQLTIAWFWLLAARKSVPLTEAIKLEAQHYGPELQIIIDAMLRDDRLALAKEAAKEIERVTDPELIELLVECRAMGRERRRELLRIAVQRYPGHLGLLMALGHSYPVNMREGAEERLRWFQAAVAVAPSNAAAHNNLGNALYDKGDLEGAVAAYKETIRLDPKYTYAYLNLGNAMRAQGELRGAVAAYRTTAWDKLWADVKATIALAKKHAEDRSRVLWQRGNDAMKRGEYDWAIEAFTEAIPLDPKYAPAFNDRGVAWVHKNEYDKGIKDFTEAIRLDPKGALAHNNLGWALQAKGDLDGAIAAYKEALRLDPNQSYAVTNLPRAQRVQELLPRLAEVLAGKDNLKSPAETCEIAWLCAQPFPKRYADATRLYRDAFAADPKLAEDLRYQAACCAALAGCGQGANAAKRDAKDKARLRGQALRWLRADLALRRRQANSEEVPQRRDAAAQLSSWLKNPDFKGVRPGPERIAMPEEEAAAWDKLWADVKATIALAQKAPPATSAK